MIRLLILSCVFICAVRAHYHHISQYGGQNKTYQPNWRDLGTRPIPAWYDKAKIGIGISWGVYSVPSFKTPWFWYRWRERTHPDITEFMKKNYPPGFTYQEFAPMFTAEFFDPKAWAQLFAKAGAKYVLITSKTRDGFAMFPTQRSIGWNSVDVGPKRDLVGELSKAIREESLKYGIKYSLFEWYHPLYIKDKETKFKTRSFADTKVWPEIKQLVNDYKPSLVWTSDGRISGELADDNYWRSTDLLAWLYNESPVKDEVVVNHMWGRTKPGQFGDVLNCFSSKCIPHTLPDNKWVTTITIDTKCYGYRRNIDINDIISSETLVHKVVVTVSFGGNAIINVAPTKEGTITPIYQERLLDLGTWLSINGEAIFNSSPWYYQNDTLNSDIWYTCTKTVYNADNPTAVPTAPETITAVYAIFLKWPKNNVLILKDVTNYLQSGLFGIEMLDNDIQGLTWHLTEGHVTIQLPEKSMVNSKYAWTLKIFRYRT